MLTCPLLQSYQQVHGLHLEGPSVASWWDSGCSVLREPTETHPGRSRRVEEISVGWPGLRDPEGVRMNGNDFLLMVQRSGIHSPVEVKVVFIPLWKQGFYISGGWAWDFWTIDCIFWFISPRVTISSGFISSSSKWKIYRLPLFSEGPVSCILYHLRLWTSSTLMMVLQLRIEVAEDTKPSPKVSCT